MSHVVTIRTQVRDPIALAAACRRLGLAAPTQRTVQLYSATADGWAVELPGWRYPLVCDTAAGEVRYDHFQGRWGEPAQLGRFLQAYAVEKARLEARRRGCSVTETAAADGAIRLTIRLAQGPAEGPAEGAGP